jgi:hypothetical protein
MFLQKGKEKQHKTNLKQQQRTVFNKNKLLQNQK